MEGFVTRMVDGTFWKFKAPDYLRLHKLITTISFKNTLQAIANGEFTEYVDSIPDEFLVEVSRVCQWRKNILMEYHQLNNDIEQAYMAIHADVLLNRLKNKSFFDNDKSAYRKDFARITTTNYKHLAPYLFARLDGKPVDPIIWRKHDFSKCEDITNG